MDRGMDCVCANPKVPGAVVDEAMTRQRQTVSLGMYFLVSPGPNGTKQGKLMGFSLNI